MISLEQQLNESKHLWELWCKHGVESAPIAIDWNIYPDLKLTDKEAFQKELNCNGFVCKITEHKFLFFFKSKCLEITSPEQIWTEEKFLETTEKVYKIAETYNAYFDGCGALMPTNE